MGSREGANGERGCFVAAAADDENVPLCTVLRGVSTSRCHFNSHAGHSQTVWPACVSLAVAPARNGACALIILLFGVANEIILVWRMRQAFTSCPLRHDT